MFLEIFSDIERASDLYNESEAQLKNYEVSFNENSNEIRLFFVETFYDSFDRENGTIGTSNNYSEIGVFEDKTLRDYCNLIIELQTTSSSIEVKNIGKISIQGAFV